MITVINTSNFNHVYISGIIGCIDGCHIQIPAPAKSAVSYINRKGYHSVLLQAVCDHELMFTDCYAGEVGSVHDACVLRRSDLFTRMNAAPESMFYTKKHLMVAFKNNGNVSREQERYNKALSAARSSIERAFALLKGRFRRLKYLDMYTVQQIPLYIMACCILHNVCLRNDDLLPDCDPYVDLDETVSVTNDEFVRNEDRGEGLAKRYDIVRNLNR